MVVCVEESTSNFSSSLILQVTVSSIVSSQASSDSEAESLSVLDAVKELLFEIDDEDESLLLESVLHFLRFARGGLEVGVFVSGSVSVSQLVFLRFLHFVIPAPRTPATSGNQLGSARVCNEGG